MVINNVDYEELKKQRKDYNNECEGIIKLFFKFGFKCVEVIDNENHYNNNNDLACAFRSYIKRDKTGLKDKVKVFMLNGKVYLKRKWE